MQTRCLIVGMLLWVFTGQVSGEQLSFSLSQNQNTLSYDYRWSRQGQQPASLSFSLDRQAMAKAPAIQNNYSPALVQRYVYVELMKAAKEIDPKQAKININRRHRGMEISVSSTSAARNKRITEQLSTLQEQAYDSYLQENYYTRYTTVFNEEAVKPDHIRFIHEYIEPLIPLSQAIYDSVSKQADAREYFNFLLSWVQSIPYDRLANRADNNGAGFLPPAGLLAQNKGDCDSKSVMTAAIARGFLPDTPMILVLLPGHALLGVALTPQAGDQTLTYDSKTYVLFEPTGPAQLPMGQVAPDSRQALANRHFTIEQI
ncbi:hypothetical protein HHX48_09795 [Salinimonas sp. HHU 13199]|uniref:Transglutaminase domain-containing protein n=1 Tax=Salinimonas profundi TaxID=2729140 RepID=A0ABR8LQ05_9ALTE|nr:hypothetical protein [Salinimonas profundi]MBD3586029.1 hypothetical protein [Salinimonas profundi]